jgi:hypothetical protein
MGIQSCIGITYFYGLTLLLAAMAAAEAHLAAM